jgi:pyruvate formate lyase activating enzyme
MSEQPASFNEARFWEAGANGAAICRLCPHGCQIAPEKTGICGARENHDGALYALNYGLVSSLALDPIEKKPLRRFHPGKQILSIGGFGCNLHCPFCQNCHISLVYDKDEGEWLEPHEILAYAAQTIPNGNIGVAFTYNEPFINYEYVYDCAKLIHSAGMQNVLVTNGFVNREPLAELLPYIDAMNIDLKGFTAEFYRRVGGELEAVKETIALARQHCHVEVTTLVIPDENEDDVKALAEWLALLDPELPLHLTRFYPRHLYSDRQATSPSTIAGLAETARQYLRYVYI